MKAQAWILIIILVLALFIVSVWLGQAMWLWVVPDVFEGMVNTNLLPAQITFLQSLKLMLIVWTFIGTRGSSSKK